jgi:hypothetical protein
MQSCLGSVLVHQEAGTSVVRMVNLPGAVNGGDRSSKVRKNTSHSQSVSFARDVVKLESILDGFLGWTSVYCRPDIIERKIGTHQITLDTSHHVIILVLVLRHTNFAKERMGRRRAANKIGMRLKLLTSYL